MSKSMGYKAYDENGYTDDLKVTDERRKLRNTFRRQKRTEIMLPCYSLYKYHSTLMIIVTILLL